jgi:hypothetical protein
MFRDPFVSMFEAMPPASIGLTLISGIHPSLEVSGSTTLTQPECLSTNCACVPAAA